jgi:hypothetical protein
VDALCSHDLSRRVGAFAGTIRAAASLAIGPVRRELPEGIVQIQRRKYA